MGRTRIGNCQGPADAALVRSAFAAHGIDVVIGAEQHANLLGGLGGGFLSLDIWVDSEVADEASALLADLRATPIDETTDADVGDYAEGEADEIAASSHQLDTRLAARRNTGIAVIAALCITFGTGHMYTGAWRRGIALAALEGTGIWYLSHGVVFGGFLVGIAIFADLCGATYRARNPEPTLPTARIRR